jgi:hypothetical protein
MKVLNGQKHCSLYRKLHSRGSDIEGKKKVIGKRRE